jgi:predicted RNase H-like nuclease (RuvC/YqgF family)
MTLTKTTLAALLGVALASAPAFGQTAEEFKKAIEKLEKATKDLQEAKDALKTDEIRTKAISIETKLEFIDKDIQDLKKDIRELKRKMDGGVGSSVRSESLYQGQGRVRFINEFSEEMSVVVNGRSYRLLPGAERLIPVPPGEFSYQVLQLQRSPQERRILADETKTVRIYPLP